MAERPPGFPCIPFWFPHWRMSRCTPISIVQFAIHFPMWVESRSLWQNSECCFTFMKQIRNTSSIGRETTSGQNGLTTDTVTHLCHFTWPQRTQMEILSQEAIWRDTSARYFKVRQRQHHQVNPQQDISVLPRDYLSSNLKKRQYPTGGATGAFAAVMICSYFPDRDLSSFLRDSSTTKVIINE